MKSIQSMGIAEFLAFAHNFNVKLQNYATTFSIPDLAVTKFETDLGQLQGYQDEINEGENSKMKYELRNNCCRPA
jgi:hypothetical protein